MVLLQLVSGMDAKFWVSVYAALISTVVFVWRLYEYFDDKKGKVVVRLKIASQALIFSNGESGGWQELVIATMINRGKHKRRIERPMLKVSPAINGQDIFSIIILESSNFPLALEPGERYEYKMSADGIYENLKAHGVRMIKCVVVDTHGSTYNSSWFKI